MRVFSLLIFVIAIIGFSPNAAKKKYLIINSSEFIVRGKTSVGRFDCKYELQTKDTLFLYQKKGFSENIPVKEFRCGNFLLNNDFRKTLKHKEHPEVFFSIMEVGANKEKAGAYTFNLHLKIAGKVKILKGLTLTQNENVLSGEVELKFSDFGLSPPQKLGGAIKIEEDINLSISFNVEE